MSLQQDIIDTIGSGGIEKERLREKVGNIGQAELDCAVNALMRAGRLRLSFGRYEVVPSKRPLGAMPHPGRPAAKSVESSPVASASRIDAPPTAEEEAAASLRPATRVCQDCKEPKELEKCFSKSNLGTGYLKTCKECVGKRIAAANAKKTAKKTAVEVMGRAGPPIVLDAGAIAAVLKQESPELPPKGESPASVSKASAPIPGPARSHPTDSALENAKAARQAALNRLEMLEAEVASELDRVKRADRFIELYGEYARDV